MLFEFVTRPSAIVAGASTSRDDHAADAEAASVVGEPGFGPAVARPLALDLARPAIEEVAPLQDVVWLAVGVELAQMIIDIARILATAALLGQMTSVALITGSPGPSESLGVTWQAKRSPRM